MDPAPFELHILGPTELKGSDLEPGDANLLPPKRIALLSYLAIETTDGFRRRDQIVGLFWPDLEQDAARTQLRKALFAIRESLGPEAVISRGESEIRLDPDRVWCDAVALLQHARAERWTEALALYRGELLEGLFPEGVAQEFEEWLAVRRKALRDQAARAAWECSRIEEGRGDRKAAAVMARRALGLTPDDEDGVRRLMTLLDQQGDRGGALRVYSDWQARLKAEYGVEPAPETRKLARKVQAARKGESHETPPTQAHLAPVSLPPPQPTALAAVRSRSRRLLVVLGVLALLTLGGLAIAKLPGGSNPAPNSVAVLPLRAIGDPELKAAADGITEELTNALVMVPDLSVRSMSRAGESVSEPEDASRIAGRLGVAYLIDGGVQRAGARLRITLRLIRAADAIAIWAGSYDEEGGDLAAAALRVASGATPAIRERLGRGGSAKPGLRGLGR
jgi:DNA-binding SARP family transcriptional activator/TolB-like protein